MKTFKYFVSGLFVLVFFVAQGAQANLLTNGSFEDQDVADGAWIYTSNVTGWAVEWVNAGNTNDPNLEYHNPQVVSGVSVAADGDLYVELDSHGSELQPDASIRISQEINTCEGGEYELTYAWRPRSQGFETHVMNVYVDGEGVEAHSYVDYEDHPGWKYETISFYGTGSNVEIAFEEAGPGDQLGMFLDDVSVEQVEDCPNACYVQAVDDERYATAVVSDSQGLQLDGDPVDEARSDPAQGLAFEDGKSTSNFFSLGFGGSIVVEFDQPIYNGDGNDLKIIEDTWGGGYPLEEAEVWVSQYGFGWTLLGVADNSNLDNIHTTSEFDLGGLEWAGFVKIVDVSDPDAFTGKPDADGYDLNAVQALHAGEVCDPSISVDKSASSPEIYEGEEVTYTYVVVNDGNVPLYDASIYDDKCDLTDVLPTGDDGDDEIFSLGEEWVYECTMPLYETTTNIVTVTGTHEFDDSEVSDSDEETVAVKALGCTLTQGYWKTHGDPENTKKYDDTWDNLELPESVYTGDSTALELMWAKSGGNYWYMLFSQYIAAYLNSQTAWVPDDVEIALSQAADLLTESNLEALGGKGKNKDKDLHKTFVELSGILANYNEGGTEVPHCSEI